MSGANQKNLFYYHDFNNVKPFWILANCVGDAANEIKNNLKSNKPSFIQILKLWFVVGRILVRMWPETQYSFGPTEKIQNSYAYQLNPIKLTKTKKGKRRQGCQRNVRKFKFFGCTDESHRLRSCWVFKDAILVFIFFFF